MHEPTDVFHRAMLTLLREVFDGPPKDLAFILNPGDPGLLRQLDSIDAATASHRPMPGKTTIASHVDHVLYGLELLNRWAEGEENPWATSDWDASWKRTKVNETKWRSLVARLRAANITWQHHAAESREWNDISAAGAMSSAAHTAYHLGAIRQILAGIAFIPQLAADIVEKN